MSREASATRKPRRQRRERGSITPEEIVNGAYALAAEVSVEKLSMPELARRLDVGVTSIYWYFRSKDQLLDAMRDRALEQYEIALPFTGAGSWHERLRDHFVAMRVLFRDNPVLCDLLVMNAADYGEHPGRIAFERLENIVQALIEAGFTAEDALDTYSTLSMHSRGFAMLERKEKLDAAQGRHPAAPLDAETMPTLARLVREGHSLGGVQDRVFDAGLDALIERAKRVLKSGKRTGAQLGAS
ncbi:TetR family transcriptional regulator [Nocardia sp. alder85J]|uniref:TetR family transcriptional regulator n=1 Tax=Nocardia sp. alder85J TaxID=2862949 RepID=UPI001CD446A8|nr:TetR family transcriptional regulator [Nocardia sp. alder85J]MCX4096851.1 TetR family transcriptional regulator [Nocardia sp. alder85J]